MAQTCTCEECQHTRQPCGKRKPRKNNTKYPLGYINARKPRNGDKKETDQTPLEKQEAFWEQALLEEQHSSMIVKKKD
ncbi:hypothetical protein E2562_001969 [Oryza meyeriana var. granulata]|uniref:Uncharacterized protein n=1 Tax=Oryza meyeriana var. granulata TaxID=110450 RepID=A0A6G1C3F3_9ORYZ|nr:hypothetical protein E2562_001969 [Oryza meyeriana var. granulata]